MKGAEAYSRSANGRGRLLAAVVTLCSPAIVYLIVRNMMVGLSPSAAAGLPPKSYAPMLRPFVAASADPRVKLPANIATMAKESLTAAPLAFEPFVLLGRVAAQDSNPTLALTLMEEAKRRRPNSLVVRLHLMTLYGSERRFNELITQIDYILRASPPARQQLLPELVKLLRDPSGRRALATLLSTSPNWREDFYKTAQQLKVRSEDARELLNLVRDQGARGDLVLERGLYIKALVDEGRPREARTVWLGTLPARERQQNTVLFNGGFEGGKALPPFGWTFHDEAAGRAEIARDKEKSYLNVDYFGGQTIVLAEQLLSLAPGTYRLSFSGLSSTTGLKSGQLYWSLLCSSTRQSLTKVEANNLGPRAQTFTGNIRVPSDCAGQQLQLVAEPGDVSAPFDAQLDSIEIRKL